MREGVAVPQTQLEDQLRAAAETNSSLETQVQSLRDQLGEASATITAIREEREEVCAMLHPQTGEGVWSMSHDLMGFVTTGGDSEAVARRLVELSAEKEDLQYQLSCCQGQLETQTNRAGSTEVAYITIETITMVTSEVDCRCVW